MIAFRRDLPRKLCRIVNLESPSMVVALLTCLNKVVVGVCPEEAVGKEGDDGVDGGHVQYP